MMSIKVEASRFAVLKVEDDDSSLAVKSKPNSSANSQNNKKKNVKNQTKSLTSQNGKSNSQPLSKSNAQKSAKSLSYANGQVGDKSASTQVSTITRNDDKSQVTPSNKKPEMMVDQWEQWKRLDEKFVEHEFQEQLKHVMQESKKENKSKATDKFISAENNLTKKKNKTVSKGDLPREPPKQISDLTTESVTHQPSKTKKDKNRKVEAVEDALSGLSLEEQLEIKNQSILEIKKMIDSIQLEVSDYKTKNQKLCQYLLQGELSIMADLEREIGELREKHKHQTLRLSQLSTDLEKERSRGHVYRSELNKIKSHK